MSWRRITAICVLFLLVSFLWSAIISSAHWESVTRAVIDWADSAVSPNQVDRSSKIRAPLKSMVSLCLSKWSGGLIVRLAGEMLGSMDVDNFFMLEHVNQEAVRAATAAKQRLSNHK